MINESALGSTSSGSIDSLKRGAQNPQQPFPSFPLLLEPLAPALTAVSPFLSRSQDMAFSSHEVALWERERETADPRCRFIPVSLTFPNSLLHRFVTALGAGGKAPKVIARPAGSGMWQPQLQSAPRISTPSTCGFWIRTLKAKTETMILYDTHLLILGWEGRHHVMFTALGSGCATVWSQLPDLGTDS